MITTNTLQGECSIKDFGTEPPHRCQRCANPYQAARARDRAHHTAVVSGTTDSRLWNEYVARYHYLGYAAMAGSQIRYNVFAGDQLVACISFCACAWKLKDRKKFIGLSEAQRQKNLQLVINNARFLVLPWIESKGLASKILSLAARQLPHDWHSR
jgi:hypothetical protein